MGRQFLVYAALLLPTLWCCGAESRPETAIVYDASPADTGQFDAAVDARPLADSSSVEDASSIDAPLGECNDGIDNDGDGFIDEVDFGCTPDEDGDTSGLTEDSCTSNGSCAGDFICVDNRCIESTPCNSSDGCEEGLRCVDGLCIP